MSREDLEASGLYSKSLCRMPKNEANARLVASLIHRSAAAGGGSGPGTSGANAAALKNPRRRHPLVDGLHSDISATGELYVDIGRAPLAELSLVRVFTSWESAEGFGHIAQTLGSKTDG